MGRFSCVQESNTDVTHALLYASQCGLVCKAGQPQENQYIKYN